MIGENMISWGIGLVLLLAAIFGARRKSRRYGGYIDPVKIRFSPLVTRGFRRKRPEDGLYDDDGRINRHWKP